MGRTKNLWGLNWPFIKWPLGFKPVILKSLTVNCIWEIKDRMRPARLLRTKSLGLWNLKNLLHGGCRCCICYCYSLYKTENGIFKRRSNAVFRRNYAYKSNMWANICTERVLCAHKTYHVRTYTHIHDCIERWWFQNILYFVSYLCLFKAHLRTLYARQAKQALCVAETG